MDVITIFVTAIQCIVLIIWAWTLGMAAAGTWKAGKSKKPAEDSGHNYTFAVLICAHNEENVIGDILESLRTQTYPSDCWKVFLIADRCTDHTCSIAGKYDFVTVLRREEEGESRKGLALQWGIEKVLKREPGLFDIIMVLDADNQVIPEFLELFNESFRQGSLLVTGKRTAMNPYETLVSKWYAIYWGIVTELFCCSHSHFRLSALLSGTGFAFSVSLLGEEGFNTLSMSEDIEFSVQQNLRGNRVEYLEEAVFYDEQPTSVRVMFRQLRRWTTGTYQIVRYYTGKLVKEFWQKPSFLILDSLFSSMLCGTMGVVLAAGVGNGIIGMMKGGYWAVYACILGTLLISVMLLLGFTAVRRSGLSLQRMLNGMISFPVFVILLSCISLFSFFHPQRKWHKIEHYGLKKTEKTERGERGNVQ